MTVKNRVRHGTLQKLSAVCGLNNEYLSHLVNTHKRPGRERAKLLETCCTEIGYEVPAVLWLYGTASEIKQALEENNGDAKD